MEPVHCLVCGKVIESSSRFCPFCGNAQFLECPKCHSENILRARFCVSCGISLSGKKSSRSLPQPPKRNVSGYSAIMKWIPWIGGVILVMAGIWGWTLYKPQMLNRDKTETASELFNPELRQKFQLLRTQVEQNPKDVQSWIQLGNLFYDSKNFSEAILYYQHALPLDSTNADVRVDLAVSCFETGQSERAIAELDKALQFSPNHLNAHFNLGVVYNSVGNRELAVRYWQKYLTLQPEGELADRIRSLLAEGSNR